MKDVLLDEGFKVNIVSNEFKKKLELRSSQPKEGIANWIDPKLENKPSRVFIQNSNHNINHGKRKRGILHICYLEAHGLNKLKLLMTRVIIPL
jgi:hypothetical protein